jgi:hypothetical protein
VSQSTSMIECLVDNNPRAGAPPNFPFALKGLMDDLRPELGGAYGDAISKPRGGNLCVCAVLMRCIVDVMFQHTWGKLVLYVLC